MNAATRTNIILALVEEGKDYNEINEALKKVGQEPLVDSEVVTYAVPLKTDVAAPAITQADVDAEMEALQIEGQQDEPAPKKNKPVKSITPAPVIVVNGKTFTVTPGAAQVVNEHGTMKASAIADGMLGQMSGFLRAALGDEWYTAYKQIKNPGFTKATAETRKLAFTFALESLLALKKPLSDLKDKLDKN